MQKKGTLSNMNICRYLVPLLHEFRCITEMRQGHYSFAMDWYMQYMVLIYGPGLITRVWREKDIADGYT